MGGGGQKRDKKVSRIILMARDMDQNIRLVYIELAY